MATTSKPCVIGLSEAVAISAERTILARPWRFLGGLGAREVAQHPAQHDAGHDRVELDRAQSRPASTINSHTPGDRSRIPGADRSSAMREDASSAGEEDVGWMLDGCWIAAR